MIIRTEDTCFGRPRINGTRLEVYNIISDLYHLDKTLNEYLISRYISQIDVLDVIDYCQNLKCQIINKSYEKYCSGCLLSTLHEDFKYKEINLEEYNEHIYIDKDKKIITLGDKEDIEEELYGRPGWIMASEISAKFNLKE